MKLIGHTEANSNLALLEAVLIGTSDEVRKIADFLNATADRMDEMGSDYDHEHLSDHASEFDSSPHLVIVRNA